MNNIFWTNLTLREIQERLKMHLISVSCPVISKIMKSLRFVKRKMRKCKTLKEVENRDKQFKRIARLIGFFTHLNLPVLSIDTKKKEMLGNFYRDGKVFCNQAIAVFDHDFKSFSDGVAVPHGIYDVSKNICYLSILVLSTKYEVGTNKDTAEFVTDNLEYYWNSNIKHDYPNAKKLLILLVLRIYALWVRSTSM
jgi:hypothetical protein